MYTGPVAVSFTRDEPTCANCYNPKTHGDRAALMNRHADSKRTEELN